jgi:hypothetical protein
MVNSPITLHRNWNETIKNVFLLYNGISEQYNDPEILEKIRSLIPEQILQLSEDDKIKSLLGWFKNDFMSWTPKDPLCTKCMEDKVAMQVQVMIGMSWKLRTIEIHRCNKCGYEYTFPRYGDILKIAEIRTGRCSEWSMLFGAIMNALKTETRIVHDFLDHCWNEAMIQGKWVHMDSTLAYPISVNHPVSGILLLSLNHNQAYLLLLLADSNICYDRLTSDVSLLVRPFFFSFVLVVVPEV